MEKLQIKLDLEPNEWKKAEPPTHSAIGAKSKRMFLRIGDFIATIKSKDDVVGSVAGCIGGALVFQFNFNGEEHEHITDLNHLWDAYMDSLNKPQYKLIKPKKDGDT